MLGAVEEVEIDLGIEGIGLAPVGLTVACILASEEAVGACNLDVEVEIEGVGLGRLELPEDSAGGGGAALTFLRISA
jgi:hypothetical protein